MSALVSNKIDSGTLACARHALSCAQSLGKYSRKASGTGTLLLRPSMPLAISSNAVAAGMPLDVVQQNMGHASLDTTTGYTASEERRRMKVVQAAWSRPDSHDPS
jgi:site-specific recombinase XerD